MVKESVCVIDVVMQALYNNPPLSQTQQVVAPKG